MGNNVMLYLDDIQHTNPELLQKFISLCDAQRRIEGVWNGRTRTYDLRGKKFCVVMAGNPYTESGEKFQIPDMLANRADTYNLGDILEGKGDAFALSYIENAITSNPSWRRWPRASRRTSTSWCAWPRARRCRHRRPLARLLGGRGPRSPPSSQALFVAQDRAAQGQHAQYIASAGRWTTSTAPSRASSCRAATAT
jgi:hypothetical protein